MNNNKILYGVLGVIAVIAIAAGAYMFMQYNGDTAKDKNADTSNTSQNNSDTSSNQAKEEVGTTSFKSEKGVSMVVSTPPAGSAVASPLKVTGTVPGSWSNEGQFTIRLVNSDSNVLAESVAKLDGDWMSQNQVPFSATLTFDAPAAGSTGLLVLEKANPSGLEENADSVSIMVQF